MERDILLFTRLFLRLVNMEHSIGYIFLHIFSHFSTISFLLVVQNVHNDYLRGEKCEGDRKREKEIGERTGGSVEKGRSRRIIYSSPIEDGRSFKGSASVAYI
jgi:hypothetical protein